MNFSIEEVSSTEIDNFNITETLYQVTFDSFAETFEDGHEEIEEMLKDLVERFTALMEERDKLCVTFSHNSFSYPLVIPFVNKADFTFDLLEAYFYRVSQSYKYSIILNADSLQAKVQIVKLSSLKPKSRVKNFKRIRQFWSPNPKKIKNWVLRQSEINKQVRVICKKLNLKNQSMGIPEIKQIKRYLKYNSISMLDGKKGFQEEKFYYKGRFIIVVAFFAKITII